MYDVSFSFWDRLALLPTHSVAYEGQDGAWQQTILDSMRGQSMNWEIIASNLIEARGELDTILRNLGDREMSVGRFKCSIEHALQHVLIAWNARHMSIDRYATLNDHGDYARLCQMHDDLVPLCADMVSDKAAPLKGKFPRGKGKRFLARHFTRSEHEFDWAMRRRRKRARS